MAKHNIGETWGAVRKIRGKQRMVRIKKVKGATYRVRVVSKKKR